jgi:hypothetical protein
VVDFTPGLGDIKGAIEFLQKPTVLGGVAVVVAIVPVVGDVVGKVLKRLDGATERMVDVLCSTWVTHEEW